MIYDNDTLPRAGKDFVYVAIKPQDAATFAQVILPLTLT